MEAMWEVLLYHPARKPGVPNSMQLYPAVAVLVALPFESVFAVVDGPLLDLHPIYYSQYLFPLSHLEAHCISSKAWEGTRTKNLSLTTVEQVWSEHAVPHQQVLVMSASKDMQPERMRLASELWEYGVAAEFTYKANPFMPEQMSYASACGIPLGVVLRPDELKEVCRSLLYSQLAIKFAAQKGVL